jgi:glutathione S-transferase
MFNLYYSPGACSLAPHIVLEELGVAYETHRVNLAAGEQRTPEYLKMNPLGRVPVLEYDGRILTENVAILTFLGGAFPKRGLWPRETFDQAAAISMMGFLCSSVHPAYSTIFRPSRWVEDASAAEALKATGRKRYFDFLKMIDAKLAGKNWFMGRQYTVVDPYLLVFYRWGNRIGLDVQSLANYSGHIERLLKRPAVKRVMEHEGITLDT